MATLTNGTNGLIGEITLTKHTGTVLTLSTNDKYVDDNIQFSIGVQSGAGAANTASADADVESTDSSSVGGVNISGSIGTKQTTEPASGYYIRIGASGSGSSKITTPGWLDAGNLPAASATATVFFPIDEAEATITGTNVVTPAASIAGTNVTLSNTNNGISVTATGGGTATASATCAATKAGYVASGTTLDTEEIVAASASTSATTYISGVTITAPASGTRQFSVTVPNGSTTATFVFNVDQYGNVRITET